MSTFRISLPAKVMRLSEMLADRSGTEASLMAAFPARDLLALRVGLRPQWVTMRTRGL